jgi:transcriptional regulator with XRE-family HTH domain
VVEVSSPTVWRRWLAFELTRLREEAGLTQKDVATALRCSDGKVSYYETAERTVVVRDLDEVLLPLYNVPAERWPLYLQAAKDSRQKGWWERYDTTTLPSWFSLYVGLEQGATQLRSYAGLFIPGLLQTTDYADGTFRRTTTQHTEDEIEHRVELRLARQAVLDRDPDPLRLSVVLDEAALRRAVNGPDVMKVQLLHLAAAAERPHVTIQVVPFTHGFYPGMTGSFQILGFAPPTDPGVVYIEHRGGALYLEQALQIEEHIVTFEHICFRALPPDDSVALIHAIAKETP